MYSGNTIYLLIRVTVTMYQNILPVLVTNSKSRSEKKNASITLNPFIVVK